MSAILLFCVTCFGYVGELLAAPPRDLMMPAMQFDIYNIKTPQLIGIIAGCCVFTITIGVVIYLLLASGTLQRALSELANDGLQAAANGRKTSDGSAGKDSDKAFISPYHEQPELYDHLLLSRSKLPSKVNLSQPLSNGLKVSVRSFQADSDIKPLFEASNGSPQYHESAYDPGRIWGWCDLDCEQHSTEGKESLRLNQDIHPWESLETFTKFVQYLQEKKGYSLFVIVDKEFSGKVIGMIFMNRNEPLNLSINIEHIWITPAFQGTKKVHEALLLLLSFLFEKGYRRITAILDERHYIARKFLMRCGFLYEGTLRKHRIVRSRNCNSAVYSIVNSDWIDAEGKLQRYCGWPKKKSPQTSTETVSTQEGNSSESKLTKGKNQKKPKKK